MPLKSVLIYNIYSGGFMTKVFVADILIIGEDLAAYYDRISQYRQNKIEKLKVIDHKKQSLLAELLLSEYLGRKPQYDIDANGMPTGEEVEFSFSHSGDLVLCAVSDAPVGADVEKVRKINLDVAKKFAKDEYETIINSQNPEEEFFNTWVKKESFLKMKAEGIKGGLDTKIYKGYTFTMCNDVAGYKICVCAKEPAEIEFVVDI